MVKIPSVTLDKRLIKPHWARTLMAPRQETGIYPVEESVRRKRETLVGSALPRESVDLILRFIDKLADDGLTAHRQSFYLSQLRRLAEILGEAFPNPSKEHIERAVAEIEGRPSSDWTKTNYKTSLKRFYKWHLGGDEEYPSQVRWVRTRRTDNDQLPNGLLTRQEVTAMVRSCRNSRDKALISSLADSGCRIGELLSMRLGDVTFDQYGVVFKVSRKTGDRQVRVVGDAIPCLAAWIEIHPDRTDPHAPLWTGLDERTRGRPVKYAAAHKVLKTAAQRAGIKKRVHAQLFRHTRAAELARKVTGAPLEDQMGWVHGSGMAKVYVHLPGKEVDRVLLEAEGTELPMGQKGKRRENPKVCPRCEAVNLYDSTFCRRCRLPLTPEAVEEIEGEMGRPQDLPGSVAIYPHPRVQKVLSLVDLPFLLIGVVLLLGGIFLGPSVESLQGPILYMFTWLAWPFLTVGVILTVVNIIRPL